jgi:hypothetical protein
MGVMTAPRRLLAAVVVMVVLVAFALLLWRWLPGPRQAEPAPAEAVSAITGARALRASGAASLRAPPRLLPATPEPTPPPMPEGLAQDLETFDGVQLKAELESIALSHPEVRVLDAACTGLPCRAQASSTSALQLSAFVRAVNERFQGHMSTRIERKSGELQATFWVGTTPEPPAERP